VLIVVVTDDPCATVSGPGFESVKRRELLMFSGSVNDDVSDVKVMAPSSEGEESDEFPDVWLAVAGVL
jgi:hypothetical protein